MSYEYIKVQLAKIDLGYDLDDCLIQIGVYADLIPVGEPLDKVDKAGKSYREKINTFISDFKAIVALSKTIEQIKELV